MLYRLFLCFLEPGSLRQLQSDTDTLFGKSSVDENGRADDLKLLAVSSSRTDRIEAPVSSSAYDSRYLYYLDNSSLVCKLFF